MGSIYEIDSAGAALHSTSFAHPRTLLYRPNAPFHFFLAGCIFAEILGRKPFFKGSSTREQLELIIGKLGTPADGAYARTDATIVSRCRPRELYNISRRHASTTTGITIASCRKSYVELHYRLRSAPADDLRLVTSKAAIETIRRMTRREPVPLVEFFPTATPMALDLLSRMLVFDQRKRISLAQALEHPYLAELHGRAREPICNAIFDWEFERGYPDEMPQVLLQHYMYGEMVAMRRMQDESGLNALPLSIPVPIGHVQPAVRTEVKPTHLFLPEIASVSPARIHYLF